MIFYSLVFVSLNFRHLMRYYFPLIILTVSFSCLTQLSSQTSWLRRNSPNESIYTIDVGANNDVYAATSSYGLFRSVDEGNVWSNISLGLPDSTIRVLRVSTDNKVFVGTGSHGVYQYHEGTWAAINNGLPVNVLVTDFAKASSGIMYMMATTGFIYKWDGTIWTNITSNFPTQGRTLAVGPTGTLYAGAFSHGVYSYDGTNWSLIGAAMANNFVIKITISTTDTIYAVCNSNNVFRCPAAGGTWTSINVGLPAININFITADNQNRLFIGNASAYGVIYRSTNSGNSWSSVTASLFTTSFNCMAVSPSNKIYTGASGVFKSGDGGNNWSDMNPGMNAPKSIICFKSTTTGTFFAGTKIGPWRSVDNGLTWQLRNTGVTHYYVLQITENAVGDIIFHGYNNVPKGAIYRSTNNGDSWTKVAENGCDLYTKIKQHKSDTLWASNRFSGTTSLSYSINNGASWINNPLHISAIWDLDVSQENTIFLASESEGVSRSDNGGVNFTLGVGNSGPWYGNVLEVERDDYGNIFAGSDWWTNVLWFSKPEENGNAWTEFTDPDLVVRGIQDLIFDAYNNAWLACKDGGIKMAVGPNWNASTNWLDSSVGLPSIDANMLELSFDSLGYMYAVAYTNTGQDGGLYRSLVPINPPASLTYTFTGNGNWTLPSNWKNNKVPPTSVAANALVIIDPISNGECVLNTSLHLAQGALLKIRPNKKLRLAN